MLWRGPPGCMQYSRQSRHRGPEEASRRVNIGCVPARVPVFPDAHAEPPMTANRPKVADSRDVRPDLQAERLAADFLDIDAFSVRDHALEPLLQSEVPSVAGCSSWLIYRQV